MMDFDFNAFLIFYIRIGYWFFAASVIFLFYRLMITKTYYKFDEQRFKYSNKALAKIEAKYGKKKTMIIYIVFSILSRMETIILWPKYIHHSFFIKWKK